MASYKRVRTIHHSADAMFAIISDVRNWPQILREVREVQIESSERAPFGVERLTATLGFPAPLRRLRPQLTITIDRRARILEVLSTSPPFGRLAVFWQIEPIGRRSCQSTFEGEVTLTNPILRGAFNLIGAEAVFRKATARFVHRADALYGVPAPRE